MWLLSIIHLVVYTVTYISKINVIHTVCGNHHHQYHYHNVCNVHPKHRHTFSVLCNFVYFAFSKLNIYKKF